MLTGNEAESQGLDVIVLMAGLPGTGKTTVARELASQVSGTILSKDEIRHTLFERRDVEYSTEPGRLLRGSDARDGNLHPTQASGPRRVSGWTHVFETRAD